MRFFAALLVLLSHSTRDIATVPGLSRFADLGTTGVGFFFALSGFVLTWSHREGDHAGAFYRRRFARIYPLYLATFLLAIPVLLVTSHTLSAPEAGWGLLVLQSWVDNPGVYFGMNAPSWSLSCELLFYAVFPAIIPFVARASRRAAAVGVVALAAAYLVIATSVTISLSSEPDTARFFLYVFPAFRLLGFISGCLLARLAQAGARAVVPFPAAVGALAVAYVAVLFSSSHHLIVGHGMEDGLLLPFILLTLFAAAQADIDGRPGLLTRRLLVRLGEWSFALYLTHWLLDQSVAAAWPGLQDAAVPGRVAANVGFAVVAVGLSAAFYYGLERPLERRLRGTRPRPEMTAQTVAGTAG